MKPFPGILLLLALAACKTEPARDPAVGEGYVGPATLGIRKDIGLDTPVVATVSHGKRLEILQRRRRFVRVRTPEQVEGWTDERLLLSPEDVASLRELSADSKSAPSQGIATTYETLNVHTTPDRQSPSFLQVKEGEKVDVIERRVAPRVSSAPAKILRPPPQPKTKKLSKETRKSKEIPPPPPPAPPKPPADWVELSKLAAPPSDPQPPAAPKQVPKDDWSLIRNAAGESGWVLTRRLVMAIPDEVAQYAEGRRITSYFAVGETRDGGAIKKSWLWTTVEHGLTPYDFDSFRVFVWSLRRHRYETAHIERNLTGFFPVLTQQVPAPKGRSGKVPGFAIVIEKDDGLRYRRYFAFVDNAVRLSGEEPTDVPAKPGQAKGGGIVASGGADTAPTSKDSWWQRMKNRVGAWRLFGR